MATWAAPTLTLRMRGVGQYTRECPGTLSGAAFDIDQPGNHVDLSGVDFGRGRRGMSMRGQIAAARWRLGKQADKHGFWLALHGGA